MFPPPTNNSREEKSQTRAIFGQTGKRKAELKGQALDPHLPSGQSRAGFSVHRSPRSQTDRHQDLAAQVAGRNSGHGGQRQLG